MKDWSVGEAASCVVHVEAKRVKVGDVIAGSPVESVKRAGAWVTISMASGDSIKATAKSPVGVTKTGKVESVLEVNGRTLVGIEVGPSGDKLPAGCLSFTTVFLVDAVAVKAAA